MNPQNEKKFTPGNLPDDKKDIRLRIL